MPKEGQKDVYELLGNVVAAAKELLEVGSFKEAKEFVHGLTNPNHPATLVGSPFSEILPLVGRLEDEVPENIMRDKYKTSEFLSANRKLRKRIEDIGALGNATVEHPYNPDGSIRILDNS